MGSETTVSLVTELEKIKSIRSRNSYFGAWIGLVTSVLWLASIQMFSVEKAIDQGVEWFPALMFTFALVLLLQSFYIIVRHITNKKNAVMIEAILENKKKD